MSNEKWEIIEGSDPIGDIAFKGKEVFRLIKNDQEDWVISLLAKLEKRLLGKEVVNTSVTRERVAGYALVLKHERIDPVIYAEELPTAMFVDVNEFIGDFLEKFVKLKLYPHDLPGANIQFCQGHFTLMDLGTLSGNADHFYASFHWWFDHYFPNYLLLTTDYKRADFLGTFPFRTTPEKWQFLLGEKNWQMMMELKKKTEELIAKNEFMKAIKITKKKVKQLRKKIDVSYAKLSKNDERFDELKDFFEREKPSKTLILGKVPIDFLKYLNKNKLKILVCDDQEAKLNSIYKIGKTKKWQYITVMQPMPLLAIKAGKETPTLNMETTLEDGNVQARLQAKTVIIAKTDFFQNVKTAGANLVQISERWLIVSTQISEKFLGGVEASFRICAKTQHWLVYAKKNQSTLNSIAKLIALEKVLKMDGNKKKNENNK